MILNVEISETPSSLERGLMFRKALANNKGMIFIFSHAQELRFWGYNTYIPLDIAFIDKNLNIVKIADIKPLSTKIVSSDKECIMAIEANLDFFRDNKIRIGDKVEFIRGEEGMGIVKFKK